MKSENVVSYLSTDDAFVLIRDANGLLQAMGCDYGVPKVN